MSLVTKASGDLENLQNLGGQQYTEGYPVCDIGTDISQR